MRAVRLLLGMAVMAVAAAACTSPSHHPQAALHTTTTTLPRLPGQPPPVRASARLTLSSRRLRVGDLLTMKGADCPGTTWGTATLQPEGTTPDIYTGGIGLYDGESEFTTSKGSLGVIVSRSGHWTMTAKVPMVDPGPAHLVASCASRVGGGIGDTEFNYRAIAVTITTPDAIEVEPSRTVAPGTTLTVTSRGSGCGIPGYPYVALYTTTGKVTQLAQGTGVVGTISASGWQDTLEVPSTLPAGRYFVEADCFYSRGLVLGSYPGVTLTVT